MGGGGRRRAGEVRRYPQSSGDVSHGGVHLPQQVGDLLEVVVERGLQLAVADLGQVVEHLVGTAARAVAQQTEGCAEGTQGLGANLKGAAYRSL